MRYLTDLLLLAIKQIIRHPARSTLTALGIVIGMFLFTTVEAMQQSMRTATQVTAQDERLIVYRSQRFCPMTSIIPEHYQSRIERVPGVVSAVPMKVVVSNCSASLDVVTFRGMPRDNIEVVGQEFDVSEGSIEDWLARSDAALVGDVLAQRRGVSVGDTLGAAGVTVHVAGIISSENPQERNSAYVHLDFLQRASGSGQGTVTQYMVMVDDPERLDEVAVAIDDAFAHEADPTSTRPEKAFVAATAGDMLQLIGFTRYVGLGAVVAVMALVANAMLLAVRSRVKEHAILRTLGFGAGSIAALVVLEGVMLGVIGGVIGVFGAVFLLSHGGYSLSAEGLSIVFSVSSPTILTALVIAVVLALAASALPAWQAMNRPLVASLRGGN